ncbi:hypothetical protein [Streptomyces microflavus]|uniref:hypothetical protein n=1 Tax=Streptomyces microflavus TaxID=1919 RepID=UPI0033EEB91C
MRHPESDLPGRPAERAPDERPGGCADPAVGLLLTISEAVVLAVLLRDRWYAGATARNARAAGAERAFGGVRRAGIRT